MAPATRNSTREFVIAKRSKRITLKRLDRPAGYFAKTSRILHPGGNLAVPASSTVPSTNGIVRHKTRKTDANQVASSCNFHSITSHSDGSPAIAKIEERTSTPTKKAKRLSEQMHGLSPIEQKEDGDKLIHSSSQPDPPTSPRTPPPANKLGRPLLSSTKLENRLDTDRLTNAVGLYQGRLRVRIDPKQTELIKSQLLHKNAIFDTFLTPAPTNDRFQTPGSRGRRRPRMRATSVKRKVLDPKIVQSMKRGNGNPMPRMTYDNL